MSKSGQASDFKSRQALAQRMGIKDYKGTAAQNTQMLQSLQKQAQDFAKTPAVATERQDAQAQQAPQGQLKASPFTPSVQAVQAMKAPQGSFKMTQPTPAKGPTQQPSSQQKPKSEAEEEKVKKNYKKDENCEECGLNKTTVQEKVNISKFLKHLSEKNYSSAHKYLKAVVDEKIQRNLLSRIAKL